MIINNMTITMQPSSNTFAFPNDEHAESCRTDNPRVNPPPPALAALLSSRRPDPPGAGCSLGGVCDPPPSPYQPDDDLALRTGKMQDPPSLRRKDVHSGSFAEEDSEEYSGHDYGDANANDEDEIDDDEEDQGEGMDDTERDDEGVELGLSFASLVSSLSAATPLTLSASASFNCSMNHFRKSSWTGSRRSSIDSAGKQPLSFRLREIMMIGDDLEPVHRLSMETIQQQRKSVTAAADSSSAAARVGGGELILGDSRGHSEFITSEFASLPPPITSTTPAPPTAAGTQAVEEAASILSRWRFRVEEEEESENAATPDDGSTSHEHRVERTPAMNPMVGAAHDYPLLEHTSERTP